jgi:hypothetical protein
MVKCEGLFASRQQPCMRLIMSSNFAKRQCASAQTFFLVKYMSPAKMIKNTNT